jgi:lipopolysaccharide biosynthesis protein
VLVSRRLNWGEDRVMFFDAYGRLRSMPTSWTSLAAQDAFAQTAGGRSWFRVDDLRKLSALLEQLGKPRRKRPEDVKRTLPHL